MKDKEVVKLGRICAKLFHEAWKLRIQIDEEIVGRFGFDSVKDFVVKTGKDYENDVLIDCLDYGSGSFTMKDWKMALSMQKLYVERTEAHECPPTQ